MKFTLQAKDPGSSARSGLLELPHGDVRTPCFMPVGTLGTVKAVHGHELIKPIEADIILGNTYHLYLRPGTDLIKQAGGLHNFMSWNKPILTDSGGYQVYSLSSRRDIEEEGVFFRSHIDGSKHTFTPENIIKTQRVIGADVIMAFDECTPYPCSEKYAEESMERTHRWLDRCLTAMRETDPIYGFEQTMSPIVQGSTFSELRRRSAGYIAEKNALINAIGGLSVGEPHEDMYAMTALVCDILPEENARYLMGVGKPENILECIDRGIDLFDCVLPTRNARHGQLYTWAGRINIRNAQWKDCFDPIDPRSASPYSRTHSRAYLRHLFQMDEILAMQIASVHNLCFFRELVRMARTQIEERTFRAWKEGVLPELTRKL